MATLPVAPEAAATPWRPSPRRRTKRREVLAAVVLVASISACSSSAPETDPIAGEWQGETVTEGEVTTLRSTSGSLWRGTATLVEEARIGAEVGDEVYMLGQVSSLAVHDGRIYVADRQVPALRVYDLDGAWLRDIGREGEGPGEYVQPASVAVAADGRIFLRDDRARRINIYSPEGEFVEAYRMGGGLSTSTQMVLTDDAVPYTLVIVETLEDDPDRLWRLGMQAHGPDGPYGEPIAEPEHDFEPGVLVARHEGSTSINSVPFYPSPDWALTPALDVVTGVGDRYRFEVRRAAGGKLVVEKWWEPVPVDPEEAAWHRRRATANARRTQPGWVWNGPEIPEVKPAFDGFVPTRSGEIWVLRPGPGERLPDCAEDPEDPDEYWSNPCWRDRTTVDAFDAGGRFLGEIELPEGLSRWPPPFVRDDLVVARVQDELGTAYVVRYRLTPP